VAIADGVTRPVAAAEAPVPPAVQAARAAAAAAATRLATEVPAAMTVPEPPAAVLKQGARIAWIDEQLAASALAAEPQLEAILAAYRARAKLEEQQAKLRRKANPPPAPPAAAAAAATSALTGEDGGPTWAQFMAVCEVLREYGALIEWEATELGELVAELAGENELWLAIVMLELADKDDLRPEQLAAVLAATLDERMRPNAYVAYATSEPVLELLEALEARADVLSQAQFAHGLTFPIGIETGACAIVEAWAQGETWERLVANTSLDGGDLYRILRRSIDLLRGVASVPYVSETVQRRAGSALRAMNRFPVADDTLMSMPSADVPDEQAAAAAPAAVE